MRIDHKKTLDKKAITSTLAGVIWDYDVNMDEVFELLTGKRSTAGPFTFDRLWVRMLERLSWYELCELLGLDYIQQHLTEEIVAKIRMKTLRRRYETIRQFLSGNPVSLTGWNPEYREEIRHTLLSNRWYRAR
jgi:hypothetical protein